MPEKRQKLEEGQREIATAEMDASQEAQKPVQEESTTRPDEGVFVSFTVVFGKTKEDVAMPEGMTVGRLRKDIEERTTIAANTQKLLLKGKPLVDDEATLKQAGIKSGAKLMLIGTPAPVVEATRSGAPAAAITAISGEWDAKPEPSEPWCKQQSHAKIIAKGKPDDAVPGISGKQVPLPDEVKEIRGLLNSQGTKVRAVFKPESEEFCIYSASSQQRVPYASVKKIESQPIEGQEEYSIVSLVLGSGKYFLYFFPSQHVASLKIRICGVASLLM